MLDKSIRILNFDDSVVKQKKLLAKYNNDILDLKYLGPRARYYSTGKVRNTIELRIRGSQRDSVTFLGSGDFHHISEILISQFSEPINVIVFDFHPDWDNALVRYGCGSWVNEILKRRNVSKVFLIGVSSPDIDSFDIQSGNLGSLKGSRVEIYPYEHAPSRTFMKKIPQNVSMNVEKGLFFNRIHWKELKNMDPDDFFRQILSRISVKETYISIDKDCLKQDSALTNWEEGKFPLDELLPLLKQIKENLDIVGMDIAGDYSPIYLNSIVKKAVSYLDHPKAVKAAALPEALVTSLNEETNLKLLQFMN
ncbi:MAG: arginase family protein [Candidatus Omnitrophica bacterium]|nr:arginase family protein [Candidatus Omnitrophota bacterium]